MADCLQFDCFGDLLFIVWCAGLPADFGLEESVDQCGLAQTTLTCRHRKTKQYNTKYQNNTLDSKYSRINKTIFYRKKNKKL